MSGTTKMNLGDPELELTDPTPNVQTLFINFDKLFFMSTMSNRVVVRWSKKMYSCAGICSYERRTMYCDIALSEPLLKLRPRKNLVETLLHEMIHAYLFITNNDRDRDDHGPNFQAHMHRINLAARLNITVYHDFIDEVKLYLTHVWRCNGPCQSRRPFFGIVHSSVNRAPGPKNSWWSQHKAKCGGNFIKIKEPEKPVKAKVVPKHNAITNYIPSHKSQNNIPQKNTQNKKPVLINSNHNIKSNKNNAGTVKNNGNLNPSQYPKTVLNGKGQILGSQRSRSNSADVAQTLRKVRGSKDLINTQKEVIMTSNPEFNPNKHKLEVHQSEHTPSKIKKIDKYFKPTTSAVSKDLNRKNNHLASSEKSKKTITVNHVNVVLVRCPVCNTKVKNDIINRHLDECLNRDVIFKISSENKPIPSQSNTKVNLKGIVNPVPKIPKFNEVANFKIDNEDIKLEVPDNLDSNFVDELLNIQPPRKRSVSQAAGTSASISNSKLIVLNVDDNKISVIKDKEKTGLDRVTKVDVKTNTFYDKTCGILPVLKNKEINSNTKHAVEYLIPKEPKPDINKRITVVDLTEPNNPTLNKMFKKDLKKSKNNLIAKEQKLEVKKLRKKEINLENNRDVNEPSTSEFHSILQINTNSTNDYPQLYKDHMIGKSLFNRNIDSLTGPDIDITLPVPKKKNNLTEKKCICCNKNVEKSLEAHLEECVGKFFPVKFKPSEDKANDVIIIDDDDDFFDESVTLNPTGTKYPCPCCFKMIEQADMNNHLDMCLQ